MLKIKKGTIHWFDTSSGEGLVLLTHNNTKSLVYITAKPDYYAFDNGEEVIVTVFIDYNIYKGEWVEYAALANINRSLTNLYNWNKIKRVA